MNLKHISIEKLDSLPYRECGKKITTLKGRKDPLRYRYQRHYWSKDSSIKAERILRNANGKDADTVLNKVKSLVSYEEWKHHKMWLNYQIESNSNDLVLTDHYGAPRIIPMRRYARYGVMYIGLDGKFHRVKYKSTFRTRYNAREHYSYITNKRKEHKQRYINNKERGLKLLKYINNPNLYTEYKFILSGIESCKSGIAYNERNLKNWKSDGWLANIYSRNYYKSSIKRHKEELKKFEEQKQQFEEQH